MFLAPATSFSCPITTLFYYYYNQLGVELQKIKQLLGLKHVTISNFAYENIATTLHNHISVYYTDVILFFWFHKIRPHISMPRYEIHVGKEKRSAVGSTKLIGQLLWALFIVIQSVFCFGLFVYMFIGTWF